MKYLHVFTTDENEKFSKSFMEFINKNFDSNNHYFLLSKGKNDEIKTTIQTNVKVLPYNLKSIRELTNYIYKSKKYFFMV